MKLNFIFLCSLFILNTNLIIRWNNVAETIKQVKLRNDVGSFLKTVNIKSCLVL